MQLRRIRGGVIVRSAIIVGATALAYHYSLLTLMREFSLQTPLSYLGLVPFIALILAAARGLTPRPDPDIHDRFVDYVIGLSFLVTALAIALILSVHASEYFWLWRLDLLSLPLFVAGTISLVFGVRVLWHLRFSIAYLAVAWPVPYVRLLTDWMGGFTDATLSALRLVLRAVPAATPVVASDGSLFSVAHAGQAFVVSVVSACTGVDGLVAFVVVGTAFAALVRGRLLAKLLWLAAGMAVIWALNLIRILLIFGVGHRWGEAAAIDGLHPFVGLVTFSLGILLMIVALPAFRLTIGPSMPVRVVSAPTSSRPGPPAGALVALSLTLAAGAVAGVSNADLQRFEPAFSNLGSPRLLGLSDASAPVAGWSMSPLASYPWARLYFGTDSTWIRYEYAWQFNAPDQSGFRSATPVILDVISASDPGALSTYGLQACYSFHSYRMVDVRTIDLGSGVTAHSVVYYNPKNHADWLAVYWELPIRSPHGVRYQRAILNMVSTGSTDLTAPPLSPSLASALGLTISDLLDSPTQRTLDLRLTARRDFLIGFAQAVVSSETAHSAVATAGTADP